MFIEDFAPIALQYRSQWFPHPLEVLSTGDRAGESFSPHGVSKSAVDVLRANGVNVQAAHGANRVDKRDSGDLQTLPGYMRRLSATGAGFRVNPRFVVVTSRGSQVTPVLVDGFEAGHVWVTKSTSNTVSPNTRRPFKDGFYDHSQNCVEYVVLWFGPTAPTRNQTAAKDETEWPVYIPMGPNAWML